MHNSSVAAIAVIGLVFAGPPAASAAEVLITQAEAALPAAELAALGTRGLTRGPRIEQISPDPHSSGAKSPFPLEVRFVAHNDTKVDPDSVKVTYLRSPAVDLTPRLKTHITTAGIDMGDAQVPPGTHMIRIDVRDTQGRNGTSIIKLSVLP